MEEFSLDYFEVDIGDIFCFQKHLVLTKKTDELSAKTILDQIQKLLIKSSTPSFTLNDSDREYFIYNLDEYKLSLNAISAQYKLEHFFIKDKCFSYNITLKLIPDDIDFGFFFLLKLNQYNTNLQLLSDFLKYQNENSFQNQSKKFYNFLKLLIRQNKNSLSTSVFETTNEWINEYLEPEVAKNPTKKYNKKNAAPPSFTLIKYSLDPNYFIDNIVVTTEIFQQLISNHFIEQSTNVFQFIKIFKNEKIEKHEMIEWLGTLGALKSFIKLLNTDLNKTIPLKQGQWTTATCCFTKGHKPIKDSQLSQAQKSPFYYDKLKKILFDL